jgi:hypothetical protein
VEEGALNPPSNEEIVNLLLNIITDGFNRSLGALEATGAVDARTMRRQYQGMGSKYYDLVTEQMMITARSGVPGVRALFEGIGDESGPGPGTA